ncbi:hypothetical protein AArcMg_0678 [Natrarchaeobaculum sulfurireducens]|uniref:Uncharacterized protein n=1 Tax=Natrarchaeobaculum sulfurireducens TaxID=2044521 RepID=A0A346PMF5_9EURY|nr:hypothetical protein AArcMg_0678 [Natrarchaeobaculum sulfurireducens]
MINYFYALRPLKDEGAVKNFWDSVVLWEERKLAQSPQGPQVVTEEVTGFDTLAEEAVKTRVITEERDGYLGTREIEREIPERLPPDILLRVSAQLDRAAGKLGFVPETESEVIETILDDSADPKNTGEEA